LNANGLVEVERIAEITARLAVNRTAWKTRPEEIGRWLGRFREVIRASAA
jgi:ATP phosphoribosyltransferase